MAAITPTSGGPAQTVPGAGRMLALLLIINLFNYIDRQVLSAVLPLLEIDADLFRPDDPNLEFKLGLLTSAFLVSYTLLSPVFGWFGDHGRRWLVVGIGVTVWSLASGASGLAVSFAMLLLTRCLVGVGEAAYGPVAPSMISDLYPLKVRGKKMALFYLAIPVGSALGFIIGGQVAHAFGWRAAFLVTLIGLLPAALCFIMREPPRSTTRQHSPGYLAVLRELLTIRSFVLCCLGMTATTFMLGGVAAWTPRYIFQREARFLITDDTLNRLERLETSNHQKIVPVNLLQKLKDCRTDTPEPYRMFVDRIRQKVAGENVEQYLGHIVTAATSQDSVTLGSINLYFGAIVVLAGFGATILGGLFADWLRDRGTRGAYFQAAGWTTLLGWPCFVAALFVPFPLAWACLFAAVFFLFFNTGPANTILANVTRPEIRATAFAINILVIHMLGDVISPPVIGLIAGAADLHTAFLVVSSSILLGGTLWILGSRFLDADTQRATPAN